MSGENGNGTKIKQQKMLTIQHKDTYNYNYMVQKYYKDTEWPKRGIKTL